MKYIAESDKVEKKEKGSGLLQYVLSVFVLKLFQPRIIIITGVHFNYYSYYQRQKHKKQNQNI